MKRFSIFLLLAAFFMPLAMNAQTRALKKSIDGFTKLEMKAPANGMSSDLLLSKIEPAREAALEELNGRGMRAVGDYELVTGEQVDWSGDYVITAVSGTTAYVMTGKSSGGNYGAYTTATVSNNTLSYSAVNNYKVTITEYSLNDTYYCTIKQGNYYLALTNAGNYLYFVTTDPATQTGNNRLRGLWTISYEDDDYVKITNAYTTSRYIRFNTRNNQQRFACYQSSSTSVLDVSLFKYNDGSCVPPTDFEATDVDLESATLSWTENGQSQYWVIYYMGENDATTSYEIATSNPFTLSGLTPATTYYALVVPYCGGLDQDSEVIMFTTEDYPCPAPTNLSASDVTMSSATVSWEGEASSYTLQYRPAASNGEARLFQDFESGDFGDWTTVRNGGGTTNTDWRVINPNTAFQSSPGDAHSGDYLAMSRSWASSAYSVDNWLISPQFTLGGTLKYWVMDDGEYHETYYICVSTSGNAVSNFTQIYAPGDATGSWTEVTVDLSAYEGMTGYIAFHHTDYDQDYLFIDDIGVYDEGVPAGEWVTVNNATSPYTITGLQGETTYEWQVMGDCGSDGQSLWSSSTFTTASACSAPVGLTANDITNTSAALSWTGYTDSYNVQYRELDPDAPATVILTTTDIWDDGSGYQMLLDADATAYDNLETNGISDYSIFEYLIPTNATYDPNTSGYVLNNSVSIQIPAGTYDFFITNPSPDYNMVYIASSNGNVGGRQDNYVFEAGKTYEFVPSLYGNYDGVDVTITADWTVVENVTNPYTLTGLNMDTQYEVQVQGVNCDGNGGTSDWSDSEFFTTLNGILVTNITADDVTVLVGETASITNLVVEPSDATNPAVTYTSGDETIATVNENGVVTGVAVGTTTITIAATDGSEVTGTINVTVTGIDVTNIAASDITVVNGETAIIDYTVNPETATDPSVIFTSNDETIATVDADGVVTGVSVGNTTITIASVSNPEVTATINVTVTSNPNAVQFTVNAPANAAPGQTITVEGVLTAPTSGTWNGFTGLILDITYDNTAFEYVANSQVYGPVATQAQQNGAWMQSGTLDNAVQLAMVIGNNNNSVSTEGVVFSAQFTVLAETGEYTFTAVPHDGNLNYDIELLPYEVTPSTVTIGEELYHTFIEGYGTSTTGNYYLIASPIGSVAPTAVVDLNDRTRKMTDGAFDLYYFDNNEELEWINYKTEQGGINPDFGNLTPGKGYLYANSQDIELAFIGQAYTGSGDVTLTISETNQYMANWNLVGNPFAETAYIADGRDFYTMQSNGTLIAKVNQDQISIEPMEGIFVMAQEDGETMTFTTTAPANNGKGLVLDLLQGNGLIDRAVVRFGEGRTLPKFQIKKNSTKVYIPMEGEDYAVVRSEEVGEMPVSFKAEENGSYTLSFSALNAEFGYLHLIDNMTGNDIDLLATPNYNFTAKTTDYENRFKLVFATGSNDDDSFAFFSNGSFIISNEGNAMLQVIDVNGRILSSENINGSANVHVNAAAGTYMLRLINGENVKVQKVVVR